MSTFDPRARVVVTAVVAALALGAAVAFGATLASGSDAIGPSAQAASSSSTGSDDDPDGRPDLDGDRRHPFGDRGRLYGPGPLPGRGLLGAGIHGTYVVADPDGGHRTVVTQHGEVTAVSGTSLTVTSEDGFVATYRLTDDTTFVGGTEGVGDLARGDDVGVVGERDGEVNTATHVADLRRSLRPLDGPLAPA